MHVQVAVFYMFLVLQKIPTKRSPSAMKLLTIFSGPGGTLEALEGGVQMTNEETARQHGTPWGVGVPCPLVGPLWLRRPGHELS